jgi:RimJ/RimL family protein N-acetyltransferase
MPGFFILHMVPLFSSHRLLFREFTLADADLIYDLNSDDEVTKHVHELPTTKEVAVQTLRYTILPQYKQNGFGR